MNYKNKKLNEGFTLLEILVAIGILSFIFALGLFISMDFAKSYNFQSQNDMVSSVLQKARGQSVNNINQVRHGVHFQGSPLQFIIFECPSGTPQCTSYTASASDFSITPSYDISITAPSLPFDIIFDQLNGDCLSCGSAVNITVNDGTRSYTIEVNSEGKISW